MIVDAQSQNPQRMMFVYQHLMPVSRARRSFEMRITQACRNDTFGMGEVLRNGVSEP